MAVCHLPPQLFLDEPGQTGPQTGQPGGEAGLTGPETGRLLLVLELLRLAAGWRPVAARWTGRSTGPAGREPG